MSAEREAACNRLEASYAHAARLTKRVLASELPAMRMHLRKTDVRPHAAISHGRSYENGARLLGSSRK